MLQNHDREKISLKCPQCGTDRVCRAHRNSGVDLMLSIINIYPFRCRQNPCKTRFHRFGRSI